MTRPSHTARQPAASTPRRRARLLPGVLMLALAFPSAAHPCTLEQLLQLPLERLLELRISPAHASQARGDGPADGGFHAT